MSSVKVRTFHAKQGTLQTNVLDTDKLVIAQPDNTGGNKFRTVNINALQLYGVVKEVLKNTPNLIAIGDGLLGTGTPEDPIKVDEDFLKNNWVNKRYINFAQVGAAPGSRIGTFTPAGVFTWPGHNCFLAGISQNFPAYTVDIKSIMGSNLTNRTVYLYLIARNGRLEHEWSFDLRADRYDSAFMCRFGFGPANTINDSSLMQFIRFENYRLSTNESATNGIIQGGTYPVSFGNVYEVNFTTTGTVDSNTFSLTGVQDATSKIPHIWVGSEKSRILINNHEAIVARMYGKLTVNEVVRNGMLYIRSSSSAGRPPYLIVNASNDVFDKTITMKSTVTEANTTGYVGNTPEDIIAFEEMLAAATGSHQVNVTVVGKITI